MILLVSALVLSSSPALRTCVEANLSPIERRDLGAVLINRESGRTDPYEAAKRAFGACDGHMPARLDQVEGRVIEVVLEIQRDFLRSEIRQDGVDPERLDRWYGGLRPEQRQLTTPTDAARFLPLMATSAPTFGASRELLLRPHAPYARYFQLLYLLLEQQRIERRE